MSDRLSRTALGAYRLIGQAAYPAIGGYVRWRASRGKEEPARRRERYGHASEPRPPGQPLVWVHAASVGESAAVEPLVREIAATGVAVLMTTGTVTSAGLVEERLGTEVIHQYVPLDLRPCVRRFLDHWRPDLAIFAESELWPMTMAELQRRRVPQILVNARLSDRSFRRWKSVPWLAETLLENLAHIVAQSAIDGERYHLLGARSVSVAGNLKADAPPPGADARDLQEARRVIALRPVWAALSTHEGEEMMAARIHLALREDRPRLLTVIVPRHIERADAIERELGTLGLRAARWSRGELPDPTTDVLIGDTIGDMGFYLRLCEIAFVGKSLSAEGGQNPMEAAMLQTAIVSGRMVQNFRDVYAKLLSRGGVRLVDSEAELGQAVAELFAEPETRRAMMAGAREAVGEMGGALDRTIAALDPFLLPLRLEVRRDRRGGR
ncbi:3-deoxy-D-manno-octulosonic acid transferase [Aureimonas jatrophae]|uniref:3-deoxy-D-manno-octulosonic acid transferase n=1 Tax=Aureimonas jatrophae TaxID=1166073 RepID=A0A1H0DMV8_9HYPH|nr:3-deoxy-D-manno-octulosonic acid transferase [Aureimonas jatrophae]MBB3951984.1 3-deoxy-D-manno-octulosonic-acid transferase [Aureimonas jatrophae]SDN71510.1 3-deoxy-D-manno-octulosonic-acid transferase [Aureimonas jatrophae]